METGCKRNFVILLLLLCKAESLKMSTPLFEPTHSTIFSSTIPRYRNLSAAQFSELVKSGQPAVIEDFTRDWDETSLLGWNCDDFALSYPRAGMRAEYNDEESSPELLGGVQWRTQPRRICPSMRPPSKTDTPQFAPYILHVKQHQNLLRDLQPLLKRPYFVAEGSDDWSHLRSTVEFWLGPPGAGAMAHVDGYCSSLFSVQLSGRKRWRLQFMPPKESVLDRFDEFDGGIYHAKRWAPEHEFVVSAGEAVFLPPGWFHETLALSLADVDDSGATATMQCHVSMSYRLSSPPVDLIRKFFPRFSLSQEMAGKCADAWAAFQTLRSPGSVEVEPFGKEDNMCTDDERWLGLARDTIAAIGREGEHLDASDLDEVALSFHDGDNDGRVSVAELATSLAQWHASIGRLRNYLAAVANERRRAEEETENFERLRDALKAVDAQFAGLDGRKSTLRSPPRVDFEPWLDFEGISSNPDWETPAESDEGYFAILGIERAELLFGAKQPET